MWWKQCKLCTTYQSCLHFDGLLSHSITFTQSYPAPALKGRDDISIRTQKMALPTMPADQNVGPYKIAGSRNYALTNTTAKCGSNNHEELKI